MHFSDTFNNQVYNRLAGRMRRLRLQRCISQATLADRTEIDPNTLSNIEQRRKKPSIAMIGRIAAGLGIPPEELINIRVPILEQKIAAVHPRRSRKAVEKILGAFCASCPRRR